MMVPSSDALPELRAWAPEDAKVSWRWKEDRFVVKHKFFLGDLR